MNSIELEKLLAERCEHFKLKEKAFETLTKIFNDHDTDETFWCGFKCSEIKPVFDSFEFLIDKRYLGAIIRTTIRLYVHDTDNIWLDNLEPIGYYYLETDYDGEISDDCLVIEKEKYIKDIDIKEHVESLNKRLPLEYTKRNSIQYEYITYISHIGVFFMSKEFNIAGIFISRAYTYLNTTDNELLDKNYLKDSKAFLKLISSYLIDNNLVSETTKNIIITHKG